mmetsp:Transcript_692/g.1608  ORF Transcript_692/g.1608 Transcript_692/m.1608 type:complete len:409 (-) Transcript_692:15-1241(-)
MRMASEHQGSAWVYRSEGASCRAFSRESTAEVLLISKRGAHREEGEGRIEELEQEIWSKYPQFCATRSHIERRAWFSEQVVKPLFGETGALSCGELVRLEDGEIAGGEIFGLLLPDATRLPSLPDSGDTISIEIKPKCAAMPSPKAVIHPDHSFKHEHSRYKLQQHLKKSQGKIDSMSEYDPIQLFSADPALKLKALQALFKSPQNNLAVYVNSLKVFPTGAWLSTGSGDSCRIGNQAPEELMRVLVKVLMQQQGTLDLIRSMQAKDEYDVEAIHMLYEYLLAGKRKSVGELGGSEVYRRSVENLYNMPRHCMLSALENYLIAATAKDCSLIITMKRIAHPDASPSSGNTASEAPSAGIVHESPSCFQYRLQVIDTDIKPLSKIPAHFKLDRDIAVQFLSGKHDTSMK